VRRVFNVEIPDGDAGALVGIGAAILALYLASAACGLWTRYMSLRVTKESVTRLRARLLEKVYSLPRSYLDRRELRQLHSVVVQDSERLDGRSSALVALVLPSAVVATALAITALVLNPLLFAILAAVAPVLLLISRWIGRAVRERTRLWQRAFDVFSSQTHTGLRAMTLTKGHRAVRLGVDRHRPTLEDLGLAGRRVAWLQSAYTLTNDA